MQHYSTYSNKSLLTSLSLLCMYRSFSCVYFSFSLSLQRSAWSNEDFTNFLTLCFSVAGALEYSGCLGSFSMNRLEGGEGERGEREGERESLKNV